MKVDFAKSSWFLWLGLPDYKSSPKERNCNQLAGTSFVLLKAGNLLFPQEPTHALNLLDLFLTKSKRMIIVVLPTQRSVGQTSWRAFTAVLLLSVLSIYLYRLKPRKEDLRTGAQRHRAKKKERIKSKKGNVKKLKVMLQMRLKQLKASVVAMGMRCETVLTADL